MAKLTREFFNLLRNLVNVRQNSVQRVATRWNQNPPPYKPGVGEPRSLENPLKPRDLGFDMRKIDTPGAVPHRALPTLRARWLSNVRMFQGMFEELSEHGLELSASPLIATPFSNSSSTYPGGTLTSLIALLDCVHEAIELVTGCSWKGRKSMFTEHGPVIEILVCEELASHLLAAQLGWPWFGHPHVHELPNAIPNQGKVLDWHSLLRASFIVRLTSRTTCFCKGTGRSTDEVGGFFDMRITGTEGVVFRDVYDWEAEVKREQVASPHMPPLNKGYKTLSPEEHPPGTATSVRADHPGAWHNQLAMIHYPEHDYLEAGWMIRRWLKTSGARQLVEHAPQQCWCPRASDVASRQASASVNTLPESFNALMHEVTYGDEILGKSGLYPQGWELNRDFLSVWETP